MRLAFVSCKRSFIEQIRWYFARYHLPLVVLTKDFYPCDEYSFVEYTYNENLNCVEKREYIILFIVCDVGPTLAYDDNKPQLKTLENS